MSKQITIEIPDAQQADLDAIADGDKACLNVTKSGGVFTLESVEDAAEEAAESTDEETGEDSTTTAPTKNPAIAKMMGGAMSEK